MSELPGDFEITTKDEHSDTQSDIRVEGKFIVKPVINYTL